MSWHYLQEGEAVSWGGSSLDGAPSALLKLIPTQETSCFHDKPMAVFHRFQSGMTLQRSTALSGKAELTWFQGAFPVRTYHQPVDPEEVVSPVHARDYGSSSQGSSAKYSRDTHSSKTARSSGKTGFKPYSVTLPRWGTMRRGACFRLRMLEHDTSVKECGSLPIIGTPLKQQSRRSATFLRGSVLTPLEMCPKGFLPNPQWVEKLMGWPVGWTDLQPLETDKFQQWQSSHGKC